MKTNTLVRFVAVSFVVAALLVSGLQALLPRAKATTFIITIPNGPNAGRQVAVVSLNGNAAAAVSAHSNGLQAQAVLSVSPLTVTMNTTQGVNPAGQTVTVANNGGTGSVLNWSAVASDPWIGLSQATGAVDSGASAGIVIGANVAGLTAGTRTGTVTISDPNASNSPQTIIVTLSITAPPAIQQLDASQQIESNLSFGRQKITVPAAITVTAIGLYISPAAGFGDGASNLSIYAGDTSDTPGSLIATSANTVTLSSADLPGERLYNFNSVTLPAGIYWLVPSGTNTSIYGSTSDVYAGGYWYDIPHAMAFPFDAYFRVVTQ